MLEAGRQESRTHVGTAPAKLSKLSKDHKKTRKPKSLMRLKPSDNRAPLLCMQLRLCEVPVFGIADLRAGFSALRLSTLHVVDAATANDYYADTENCRKVRIVILEPWSSFAVATNCRKEAAPAAIGGHDECRQWVIIPKQHQVLGALKTLSVNGLRS